MTRGRRRAFGASLALMLAVTALLSNTPEARSAELTTWSAEELGSLLEDGDSQANAVSETLAVGSSGPESGGYHAVVFDLTNPSATPRDLGTLPGHRYSSARGISGSVVVGSSRGEDGLNGRAFVYDLANPSAGMRDLGTLEGDEQSHAIAVSGNLVVGESVDVSPSGFRLRPFVHDLANPSAGLQDISAGEPWGWTPAAISGTTIVGHVSRPGQSGVRAVAYDLADSAAGLIDLGVLPGGDRSQALGISGNIVVGLSGHAGGTSSHAVVFDLENPTAGIRDLGTLSGQDDSLATAVSGDLVVGVSGNHSFVYDLANPERGMQALVSTAPNGWSYASGISGSVIVGSPLTRMGPDSGLRAVVWKPSSSTTEGPTITGLTPTTGAAGGGTTITVMGTGFENGANLTIGGVPATIITVNATTITATTPAGAVGDQDVVVTNPDGRSTTLSGAFTYQDDSSSPIEGPTLTGVTPTTGVTSGGTPITVTGTGFQNGAILTIGGVPATIIMVNATTITATAPRGAPGGHDVIVTNPDGRSATLTGGFTYQNDASPTTPRPTPSHSRPGMDGTKPGTSRGDHRRDKDHGYEKGQDHRGHPIKVNSGGEADASGLIFLSIAGAGLLGVAGFGLKRSRRREK